MTCAGEDKWTRAPRIALYFFASRCSVHVISDISGIGNRLRRCRSRRHSGVRFYVFTFYSSFFFHTIIIFIIKGGSRDIYYRLRQIKYCTLRFTKYMLFFIYFFVLLCRLLQTRSAAAECEEVYKNVMRESVATSRRMRPWDRPESRKSYKHSTQGTRTQNTNSARKWDEDFVFFFVFLCAGNVRGIECLLASSETKFWNVRRTCGSTKNIFAIFSLSVNCFCVFSVCTVRVHVYSSWGD